VTVAPSGGNFATIGAALAAINPTDADLCVVRVMPGTYTESITMKSFVRLQGAGPQRTFLTAPSSGMNVITLDHVTDVTISGLGIQGGHVGIYLTASSSITVTGNAISGSSHAAIVNDRSSATLTGNTISGTHVAGDANAASSGDATVPPINEEWKRKYGPYKEGEYSSLPHEMTPEEQRLWDTKPPTPTRSAPPTPPVRNVAEFERMQGALIRYPLGISYNVVREMATNAIVYTIVSSESVKTQAINNFTSNGVNMANVQFITASTDSIYTRDYGPWGIFDGSNGFGVIDFTYNRPRPNDDAIPGVVSTYLNEPMFTMDLITAGGNYMTDGLGIAASTDLVVAENPGKTVNDIKQTAQDFLGVHTYHIVPDTTGTYIQHVDTWVKFLAVDKILIRQVPPSDPQYAKTEAAVAYFASQTSSFGTPYRIYRVYTPNNEPYTNALILNNKVLVPIMNSQWDDDAIAAYQAAMPGYQVLGFTGSWLSTDALHCRVMGIPDTGMLFIEHYPVIPDQQTGQPIEITAKVMPYSGQALQPNSPVIYWKTSPTGTYTTAAMTHVSGNDYQGFIPAQGSAGKVYYYIHAADNSGRSENHPFIGAPDPHVITIVSGGGGPPAAPSNLTAAALSASQIDLSWTDNANNEAVFKIERRIGPRGSFVQIATVGANVTTYSDLGLTGGLEYFYRVRATNGAGDSPYSNLASAVPMAGPPAAPSNLTAAAVSASQIDLAWTDNANNEAGFKIERRIGPRGSFVQLATVGANVTTYSDPGLTGGKEYFYRVRATNGAGDSGYSNTASAIP
jgi:parallel beta-helix repeat protein